MRFLICYAVIWYVVSFRVRPVSPKLDNEGMGSSPLTRTDNYLFDVKCNPSPRK